MNAIMDNVAAAAEARRSTVAAALDAIPSLTFGEVVAYFAAKRTPREIEIAGMVNSKDGELEVDGDAIVSEYAYNGAYVLAWTWVDFADTDLDKDAEPDEDNNPEDEDEEGEES